MTYFVCRPEVAEQLRKEFPEIRKGSPPFCPIELFIKNDQKQDAWEFKDYKYLRRYLDGEISELDLISMSKLN